MALAESPRCWRHGAEGLPIAPARCGSAKRRGRGAGGWATRWRRRAGRPRRTSRMRAWACLGLGRIHAGEGRDDAAVLPLQLVAHGRPVGHPRRPRARSRRWRARGDSSIVVSTTFGESPASAMCSSASSSWKRSAGRSAASIRSSSASAAASASASGPSPTATSASAAMRRSSRMRASTMSRTGSARVATCIRSAQPEGGARVGGVHGARVRPGAAMRHDADRVEHAHRLADRRPRHRRAARRAGARRGAGRRRAGRPARRSSSMARSTSS